MLMGSQIIVFDSQETKPYRNDPGIAAMNELMNAYQTDDVHRYEAVLSSNRDILDDPFIAENIDEVTRSMRMKTVLKLVAPYTRFTLGFVAKQLKISIEEVQDIVGLLIVDKRLKGSIDQEKGIVELEAAGDQQRTEATAQWATAAGALWRPVVHEAEGFRADESGVGGTFINPLTASLADFDSTKKQNMRNMGAFGKMRGKQKKNSGR